MELKEAIKGRRSIRKFKEDQIPKEKLQAIFDQARWAPSWGNTQCWTFHVLSGHPLAAYKTGINERMARGEAHASDISMPNKWPELLKNRYSETGKLVLSSLSIAREDKISRNRFYEDMAVLFGAPCLAVGCIPREIRGEYAMLDMGLIIQTLCLAAWDQGIGSCIMAVSVGYAPLLRQIAAIPDDRLIVMGVALGFPDESHPINRFPRIRMEMDDFVTWVG
ncbi:MAG: Nitroreductase NfnB [Syntrophus sp. SKADARSKE-3]|nr:Nitroreductase NfnB [Syntrophus sp. SKADARSKE-3]